MNLTQKFISDVKIFMKETGVSRTVLGLRALNDHHAVIDWLKGTRKPQLSNVDKVYAFMEKYKKENGFK